MFFFSGINYSLVEQNQSQLRESDDYGEYIDYPNKRELKKAVRENFENFVCPRCASKRINGRGVVLKFGKVIFYKEVAYKGFFGGKKYRDELYKVVWRIHEIHLISGQKSGILTQGIPPGRIYCKAKGCDWEIKAPVYPKKSRLEWYSIKDLLDGRLFKE